MDKILFLGNNLHVDTMINIAKEKGIYTIVTDNLSVEDSPVKKLADEAWDISVTDLDELETAARKAEVTAVLCGASEVCMQANRDLCKRLDLPFYVSDKAWDIVNDKLRFKEECEKFGVPVPKNFKLDMDFSKEDLAAVEYPVVVKPADGCSSIGMHICYNEEELIAGYKDAYEKSDAKKVVLEKYYSGEETSLLFCYVDGEPVCIETGDVLGDKKNGKPFLFGGNYTKHQELFEDKFVNSLKNLFKDLGCVAGTGSVQFIFEGDDFAALEMNYRLPGAKTMSSDFMCRRMIEYATGVKVKKEDVIDSIPSVQKTNAYCIWANPGVIAEIKGIETITENLHMVSMTPNQKVGDEIVANSGMRQLFAYAITDADKEKDFAKAVDFINNNLQVLDKNGNDMLCKYSYDNKGFAIKL